MAKQSIKILKQDETYRDTPYRVMQSIERAIGRKFTAQEIGWFYHTLHQAIDGIAERMHMLSYGDRIFNVVFNSGQTVLVRIV